jgi:hypothetical protein
MSDEHDRSTPLRTWPTRPDLCSGAYHRRDAAQGNEMLGEPCMSWV